MTPEAGYSGTPLPKKLGIREGSQVAFVHAPEDFAARVAGVDAGTRLRGPLDVIVLFVTSQRELARRLPAAVAALEPAGGLWVAWPKRASKVPTDLDENAVRAAGLAAGLVDNKVCAIDEVWSGLRLVRRLADRSRR